MGRQATWVGMVCVLVAIGAWTTPGQARIAAQDDARAEIRQALEEYVQAFSDKRADLIAQRSVLAPSTSISATAVSASVTAADVERRYAANLKALDAQNYQRSQVKSATVCLLSDGAAIVSGQFTRFRKDGSILAEIAATYVFAKSEGRWRIVTLINHTTDRGISCRA